jgi:hypothetical protein
LADYATETKTIGFKIEFKISEMTQNFYYRRTHVLAYSHVHISSDEVFSKILKKPSIVQKKMIPHMKGFGLYNKMKQKKIFFVKKKIQNGRLKKGHFPAPPILNIFL